MHSPWSNECRRGAGRAPGSTVHLARSAGWEVAELPADRKADDSRFSRVSSNVVLLSHGKSLVVTVLADGMGRPGIFQTMLNRAKP